MSVKIWSINLKELDRLEDLNINGTVILKYTLNIRNMCAV